MNNQLFLIIVIVVALYIIQHMSNISASSKPTSIRLPELEYVLKNSISESRKEPFTLTMKNSITANMSIDDLKKILDSVNVGDVESKLTTLTNSQLEILKERINFYTEDPADTRLQNYFSVISKIKKYTVKP